MAELKYGGSEVKIMYGDREIGGATKLEPGTIFYISDSLENHIINVHLPSTTKNWSNFNGINLTTYNDNSGIKRVNLNISGDDFKNLDTEKEYKLSGSNAVTVSRSIVDGEYRLNISTNYLYKYVIKAI